MIETNDAPYGYIIDTRIRDKYFKGFGRSDESVTHFILHGTAGGQTAEANLKWMLSGGLLPNGLKRAEGFKKGIALFQYITDRSGKIIEIINPHKYVYHSSTSSFDMKTIGCENTNPDRANGGSYTEEQYKANVWMYRFLRERFTNMKTIQGHGSTKLERTGKYKNCPGMGYDWHRFAELLIDAGFKIVHKKEKIEVL